MSSFPGPNHGTDQLRICGPYVPAICPSVLYSSVLGICKGQSDETKQTHGVQADPCCCYRAHSLSRCMLRGGFDFIVDGRNVFEDCNQGFPKTESVNNRGNFVPDGCWDAFGVI